MLFNAVLIINRGVFFLQKNKKMNIYIYIYTNHTKKYHQSYRKYIFIEEIERYIPYILLLLFINFMHTIKKILWQMNMLV